MVIKSQQAAVRDAAVSFEHGYPDFVHISFTPALNKDW